MTAAHPHDPGASTPGAPPGTTPGTRDVLSAAEVARVVDRMAHELLEKTGGGADVVLLGIPTRGATLARRLAGRVHAFEGVQVPTGALDTTLYRDDLRMKRPRALEATDVPPGGVDDRLVVLVDDVLFSGRTVRAALDALADLGRPRAVQLAVLVDRGHRQLPIRADYVGKNIPTSVKEAVHVLTAEDDGRDAVTLGPAGGAREVEAR
jgi:pyrimidine operon attenuation protein/uracil phosphoribosyltransferase